MRRTAVFAPAEPYCAINITPMIDVLLVLLIIMILSLPAPTHKLPIELPVAGAESGVPPPVHRLGITRARGYSWDGAPLAAAALPAKLQSHATDARMPVLEMKTDLAAPYIRFDETLALVKAAGISRIGFVDNPARF